MKDAEDEAFDDLAKRQGDWGGGYQAKRAMAADKLQEPPRKMNPKKELALDSLTRVCIETMQLVNDLIRCDEMTYQRGFEDGMRAALNVKESLNEMQEPLE